MDNTHLLREFMQRVWNEKNTDAVQDYLAEAYTVYVDNADPWEGKTLNRAEFITRLRNTFDPFPDVHFHIKTAIADGDRVAITWVMTGTHLGPIGGYPATGKQIEADGMTIYHFQNGKICGHMQVFDRTAVMRQLGFIG